MNTLHLMILSNQHLDKRVEGGVAELGCADGPHTLPHIFQTVPVEDLQHDDGGLLQGCHLVLISRDDPLKRMPHH